MAFDFFSVSIAVYAYFCIAGFLDVPIVYLRLPGEPIRSDGVFRHACRQSLCIDDHHVNLDHLVRSRQLVGDQNQLCIRNCRYRSSGLLRITAYCETRGIRVGDCSLSSSLRSTCHMVADYVGDTVAAFIGINPWTVMRLRQLSSRDVSLTVQILITTLCAYLAATIFAVRLISHSRLANGTAVRHGMLLLKLRHRHPAFHALRACIPAGRNSSTLAHSLLRGSSISHAICCKAAR